MTDHPADVFWASAPALADGTTLFGMGCALLGAVEDAPDRRPFLEALAEQCIAMAGALDPEIASMVQARRGGAVVDETIASMEAHLRAENGEDVPPPP